MGVIRADNETDEILHNLQIFLSNSEREKGNIDLADSILSNGKGAFLDYIAKVIMRKKGMLVSDVNIHEGERKIGEIDQDKMRMVIYAKEQE